MGTQEPKQMNRWPDETIMNIWETKTFHKKENRIWVHYLAGLEQYLPVSQRANTEYWLNTKWSYWENKERGRFVCGEGDVRAKSSLSTVGGQSVISKTGGGEETNGIHRLFWHVKINNIRTKSIGSCSCGMRKSKEGRVEHRVAYTFLL